METAELKAGRAGSPAPAADEFPCDLETPAGAFLKLRPLGARFLLESADTSGRSGRLSFVGFGETGVCAQPGSAPGFRKSAVARGPGDPLEAVKELLLPPGGGGHAGAGLLGGAVGYVSYDYARHIEELPSRNASDWPVLEFVRVDSLVAFDHFNGRACATTSREAFPGGSAQARNEAIIGAISGPAPDQECRARSAPAFRRAMDEAGFESAVAECKRHIRRGDAFQIVLSRSEEAEIGCDPFRIYRALRMGNPSPYMFYLDFGRRKLVGASPEMLVKLSGGRARISPIAGTGPRGRFPAEDEKLESELAADPKERSEHVMLVDLARNDLARCCVPGTVRVTRTMRVEKYSHVQHLVSDVEGSLAPGMTQFDLLRACFPAGTVSGAPKVRAMEIIDGLEAGPRGPYAGCVGYFSPCGDMDACLAIRTVAIDGSRAVVRAGAGIVADSDPEKEFAETENKLAAPARAVRSAEEGLL